jgi:hypothetical protein
MIFKNFRKRLVFFLVRKRLGLKLREAFQFVGQKSNAVYYFAEDVIMKAWHGHIEPSGVSLNWLMNDECEIKKCNIGVKKHDTLGKI